MPEQRTRGQAALDAAQKAGYEPLVDAQPPAGAETVEGPSGAGFYNFESPGQQLQGTLIATTPIENTRGEMVQRWVILEDGASDTVILPDHYDLVERLRKAVEKRPLPTKVWIQYRGKQAANVPSGFLQRYAVALLPG